MRHTYSFWKLFFLSPLTFGIYPLVKFTQMGDDIEALDHKSALPYWAVALHLPHHAGHLRPRVVAQNLQQNRQPRPLQRLERWHLLGLEHLRLLHPYRSLRIHVETLQCAQLPQGQDSRILIAEIYSQEDNTQISIRQHTG